MTVQVAIIGGGVSGLSCAQVLQTAGISFAIFDKGRGAGGRLSTRRSEHGRFDHGTPFFSAQTPEFSAQVEQWRTQGRIARWSPSTSPSPPISLSPHEPSSFYVGTPGMNAVVKTDAQSLGVQFQTRIAPLTDARDGQQTKAQWHLTTEDETPLIDAEWVVLAVPAEQSFDLIKNLKTSLNAPLSAVRTTPCWSVMLAFEQVLKDVQDIIFPSSDILDKAIRESAKPQREDGERWVLQATPKWSEDHLEDDPEMIISCLQNEFFHYANILPQEKSFAPSFSTAHRWRFANAMSHFQNDYDLDSEYCIAVCGDWYRYTGVEGAWLSGKRLGANLVQTLSR
ncbi:MAG: NAD(P)-binding protein [Pseudomonadota bacterium]